MPEIHESVTSCGTVHNTLQHIILSYGSLENGPRCIGAYADVTAAEGDQNALIRKEIATGAREPGDALPSGSNAELGLPINLKLDNIPCHQLRRGREPILFPFSLQPQNGFHDLQLLDLIYSARNVILQLHPRLFLQASFRESAVIRTATDKGRRSSF